jgi:tetratricopeptide (TPR) repeat protein
VQAGRELDDLVLLVRALRVEACTLELLGDAVAALAHYTQIMGLAQDPVSSGRLDDPLAAETVAAAYWLWVAAALFVGGIPVRELFEVLDAGERWLAATGHRDWRAGILLQRALVHHKLGETDAAVAAAEEALAVALQHPDAPGYALNAHRWYLGDALRGAGRGTEAVPLFRAVLDDPAATQWDRCVAHRGLGWCALDAGEVATARREARAAVLLAEPLGDDALCTSLEVLAAACRAGGDLDAAWQAATRSLEAAAQVSGHDRPHDAARTAADIALDRADLAAAADLLDELDTHAAALDATTGTTTRTTAAARRHQRLADLTAPRSPQPEP